MGRAIAGRLFSAMLAAGASVIAALVFAMIKLLPKYRVLIPFPRRDRKDDITNQQEESE